MHRFNFGKLICVYIYMIKTVPLVEKYQSFISNESCKD